MPRKLTTEEFIIKSNELHKNKYDYSLVNYINNNTKVKIICKEHGTFEQKPKHHLSNSKCPFCSGCKMNTEIFIEKANKKHNDRYDYSLVNYINNNTKVKIICKVHGIFEQRPNDHLRGQNCPICSNRLKSTTKKFIEKANKKHGNKYDYSLVNYTNNYTKIKIICKEHGIFEQSPANHLKGQNCPECVGGIRLTTKKFIEKANKKHGNKYDYSLVNYTNNYTKIKIICKEHGIFEQLPSVHSRGHGCPLCNNIQKRLRTIKLIEERMINGYQITPNYNPKSCKIFDEISLKENIHIQHAMNGGEFRVKELGYWLDGYDEKNNVVYEYDEKYHKYQTEKDKIRQKEIEDILNCKFIRIKE